KYYPSFEEEHVSKENVYSKIFHKAEYNDGFMRTVIFNLFSLTQEYLKQVSLKNNSARGALMLLDELNKRKIEKVLSKSFGQTEKSVEALKDNSGEYYYYKHVFETLKQNHANWNRFRNKNLKDFTNEVISSGNISLSNYFLIKTLSNYVLLLTKEENLNIQYNTGFLDDAIDYILKNENEFSGVPVIMLYVGEILLLKHKTDNYYYRLKEFLNIKEGITVDQMYSLHNILQTYCVYKGYSGVTGFLRERFELYSQALENNFYKGTEDLYFDDVLFPNIAQTAIKLGELDWVESFIRKYKDELSPDNKDMVVGYVTGRLLFVKGEFEKALKTLSAIKSIRHHQFKVIIRNVMLMSYYELSWYDQAENLHASYRQYLAKNEKYFSAQRFQRQVDFVKYYAALLRLKLKPNENELTKVIVELNKNTNVLERDWLMAKAKEMEDR
ncbi:MAG TPA: hypothetical protein VGK25_09715, partial [Ignavibacteria bacterium]